MENRLPKRKILPGIFLCLCTTLAFFMSFSMPESDYQTHSVFAEIIQNITLSITGQYTVMTVFFAGILYLYCLTCRAEKDISCISYHICAAVISALWLLSNGYILCGSTEILSSSLGQIVKSAIYLIGMYNALYVFFIWVGCLLKKPDISRMDSVSWLDSSCFIKLTVLVAVIWLPYFIAAFPGNIYKDSWLSISSGFGLSEKNNFSPVFFTAVLDMFLRIGVNVFDSLHVGFALYSICQYVFICLVMGYCLNLMVREFHVSKFLFIFTLIILAFSPYFTNSINMILKDVPYSFSVLLFCCQLCLLVTDDAVFFSNKKNTVILAISVIFSYLFRNNGPFVIVPTAVIISIYYIVKKKPKIAAVLLAPVAASILILTLIMNIGGYKKEYSTEGLALPLQQTARIVAFFPDELTEAEIEGLSGVCNIDALKVMYNPLLVDPVKDSGNRYATADQIVQFLKTWLKLVVKHPTTAVAATIHQNYPLIYPFIENSQVKVGSQNAGFDPEFSEELGYHDIEALSQSRENLLMFYNLMNKMPIIGLFSQQAIYIILLICMLCTVKKNKVRFILPALPSIITAVGILFAPAIQWFPRYVFPTIFCTPILMSYASFLCIDKN